MTPRRTASLSLDEAVQPGGAHRSGSPTSLVPSDALPAPAPAVSFQAAFSATGQYREHLHDFDRVRNAVRAYIRGHASCADVETLFQRNSEGQSVAHWAVSNRQSEILIAIAAPLALLAIDPTRREELRGVLMRCDKSPARCSPAHWAGLYGRSGILRLYADERLGLSDALLAGDASCNNPAHYWVMGGGSVEALVGIATNMKLKRGHPLRTALNHTNMQGLKPGDMSLRAPLSPVPSPAAGAATGASGQTL